MPILLCYIDYLTMSDGQRTVAGIIALNSVIFFAWQVPNPALRNFMKRHFLHAHDTPLHTMITSVFRFVTLY